MEVIDEEGNLFGVVNIVDALVALGVLAVVIAGVAFVTPSGGGEQASRYATIDLGEQPEYVAEQIESGDEMSLENAPGNLTVRDVHVTPAGEGNLSVVVRAQLNGVRVYDERRDQDVFEFAGEPVTSGRTIQIDTLDYSVAGTVTAVDDSGTDLETANRQVLIQTETSAETARTIQAGDTYRTANRDVATIESVVTFPRSDSNRRLVVLGLDLSTVDRGEGPRFAGRATALGSTIPFSTEDYALSGGVIEVGTAQPTIGETEVVIQTTVPTTTASSIAVGDEYRVDGTAVGTVESIQTYPTGNRNTRRVVLGLTLRTIDRQGTPQFGTRSVRLGSSIPFSTEDYALSGGVIELGTAQPTIGETEVVIQTTVPTTTASSIAVGDEYRVDGTAVGTVESIQTYPTGNRNTRRVVLGLTLRTIDRQGTPQFGTRSVRLGSSIPFSTDAYDLSGEVIRRGDRSLPGDPQERSVTVKLQNVPTELANSVDVGMSERRNDVETARITDKRVEPAEVVLTSESGDIFQREHPRNKDVYLTVQIRVRRTATGLLFHAQPLQSNTNVVLDLGSVTVRGTVIEIEDE